ILFHLLRYGTVRRPWKFLFASNRFNERLVILMAFENPNWTCQARQFLRNWNQLLEGQVRATRLRFAPKLFDQRLIAFDLESVFAIPCHLCVVPIAALINLGSRLTPRQWCF